jgi:hypothetical protein
MEAIVDFFGVILLSVGKVGALALGFICIVLAIRILARGFDDLL